LKVWAEQFNLWDRDKSNGPSEPEQRLSKSLVDAASIAVQPANLSLTARFLKAMNIIRWTPAHGFVFIESSTVTGTLN
jgi:hypothetical protein